MKHFPRLWLWAIVFLFASCENIVVYHTYHHLPSTGWSKGDTLNLGLQLSDTTGGFYQLDFLVRNKPDYKYQDLFLAIAHNFPDTANWKTDTLRFSIADNKGNWTGKGIGGIYESVLRLDSGEVYSQELFGLKIIPVSADTMLTGIHDIGVIARKLRNVSAPAFPARIDADKDEQQNSEAP